VFYISLLDIKFPEDDPKKIETCLSISRLYVKEALNTGADDVTIF